MQRSGRTSRPVRSRVRDVQVDVPAARFDAVVAFWAAAVDAEPRAAGDAFTHLVGARSPVGVHLQRLDRGAAGYHLDLEADDVAAEVARLEALGADVLAPPDPGSVLRDPAGAPFCVRPWGEVEEQVRPRIGEHAGLEFIVIDVPSAVHTATARFWTEALGAVAHQAAPPVEEFTYLSGFDGPGGPCHLLVQDTGPEGPRRLHVDLHVDAPRHRDAEVARLQELGARPAGAAHHWITLADPGGALLCVVPDHRTDDEDPT
jgi:hypothetical protein